MNEGFQRVELIAGDLFQRARNMIGPDYWLFFGITAVAIVIGSAVPANILMGPMLCGVYLCWQTHSRGEPVKFERLWKGFDHFAQSLIASLLIAAITLAMMIPGFLLFFVLTIASNGQGVGMFLGMAALYALMFCALIAVQAAFLFVYPLIADRGLDAIPAMKTSYRAASANVGGVVRVVLLNTLLCIAGAMCCGVGIFFVLPWTLGVSWLAYREVFPDVAEAAEGMPEPNPA